MVTKPTFTDRLPAAARAPQARSAGFTLPELMIGIGITAILTAMAGPSLTSMVSNHRGKAIASEIYGALSKARSLAITRNLDVTISPKTGGWQNGWQILDPISSSVVLDDRGATPNLTIVGPTSLTYRPSGRATTASSFVVTAGTGSNVSYQCVSVDLSGRPYIKAASSC